MRITLVIFSLGGGGAERVMSIMANHWVAKGWQITLFTYDDGSEPPAYGLDPAVIHRPLDLKGGSTNPIRAVASNLKRLFVLRRAIRESAPEVVISFLDVVNVRTILAGIGLGVPVIVSEHIDPAQHRIGVVWRVLRRVSYRYAASVIALTTDALGYFSAAVRRKGYVIPNPIALPVESNRTGVVKRDRTIVGMGRLTYQKGFERLLHAFSFIARKHPEWSLIIWGEGAGRAALEILRDELGLQGRVSFPGWTGEPFMEMRRAGLFVLSSRYEGFGMVLGEAMACGAPVVSFDCASGPSEIIRDGVDGVLVPPGDVRALATVMDRLLADESERDRLGGRAVEVVSRFDKEKVMGMWEAVVYEAVC